VHETRGLEGQPKGLAWRNPAKPGFRHFVPEMRPNFMKNFCKCKTAEREVWTIVRGFNNILEAGLFQNPVVLNLSY
jgi:hypothetical protein